MLYMKIYKNKSCNNNKLKNINSKMDEEFELPD